jgi:hypothetical protein
MLSISAILSDWCRTGLIAKDVETDTSRSSVLVRDVAILIIPFKDRLAIAKRLLLSQVQQG